MARNGSLETTSLERRLEHLERLERRIERRLETTSLETTWRHLRLHYIVLHLRVHISPCLINAQEETFFVPASLKLTMLFFLFHSVFFLSFPFLLFVIVFALFSALFFLSQHFFVV